jgi:hypothetical protein
MARTFSITDSTTVDPDCQASGDLLALTCFCEKVGTRIEPPVGRAETPDCHQDGFGGAQQSGTSMWSVDPQNPGILKADNWHPLKARTVDLPLIFNKYKQLYRLT